MDKNSREYEVCVCRHVTRGQIEDYLKERGKDRPQRGLCRSEYRKCLRRLPRNRHGND